MTRTEQADRALAEIEERRRVVLEQAADLWNAWAAMLDGEDDEWTQEQTKAWLAERDELGAEAEALEEQARAIARNIGPVPW